MTACIVVAGGSGTRFGRDGGKQLAELGGVPVLARTVANLVACPSVDSLIVVCDPDRIEEYAAAVAAVAGDKPFEAVPGGETRQSSVRAGIAALPEGEAVVVVHDGARPLVPVEVVERALEVLDADPEADGVVVGHPVSDTVKIVSSDGRIERTPDRERLWAVQTPQVFRVASLRAAHAAAELDGRIGTDDASLVEREGGTVRVMEGPRSNLKITTASDLVCAEALLSAEVRDGS